jgi:hypothetical protein
MSNYGFTMRVSDIDVHRDDFPDSLYEAGCDDALVLVQGDELLLDFHRDGKTFDEAVLSASRNIERAGGRVIKVEPLPE